MIELEVVEEQRPSAPEPTPDTPPLLEVREFADQGGLDSQPGLDWSQEAEDQDHNQPGSSTGSEESKDQGEELPTDLSVSGSARRKQGHPAKITSAVVVQEFRKKNRPPPLMSLSVPSVSPSKTGGLAGRGRGRGEKRSMERKYPTGADWYIARNLPVPDRYLNTSDPEYQGGRRSGGQRRVSRSPPVLTPPRRDTPPRVTTPRTTILRTLLCPSPPAFVNGGGTLRPRPTRLDLTQLPPPVPSLQPWPVVSQTGTIIIPQVGPAATQGGWGLPVCGPSLGPASSFGTPMFTMPPSVGNGNAANSVLAMANLLNRARNSRLGPGSSGGLSGVLSQFTMVFNNEQEGINLFQGLFYARPREVVRTCQHSLASPVLVNYHKLVTVQDYTDAFDFVLWTLNNLNLFVLHGRCSTEEFDQCVSQIDDFLWLEGFKVSMVRYKNQFFGHTPTSLSRLRVADRIEGRATHAVSGGFHRYTSRPAELQAFNNIVVKSCSVCNGHN